MILPLIISATSVITLLYCIRFLKYALLLKTQPSHSLDQNTGDDISVALIVPVRNEECNLIHIHQDILKQQYPIARLEVIYIDDHSTDSSLDILTQFASENEHISVFALPEGIFGKKNAIQFGVEKSTAPWIIQTDADCRLPVSFISSHAGNISGNTTLIAGPVAYKSEKGLFNKLESLEFYSMAGATAGSFLDGRPLLCNAANLSFSSDFYRSAFPDLKVNTHPSGDDVFLLETALKKKLPVKYLYSDTAMVMTRGAGNLKSFVQQRIRWGSKAKYYRNNNLLYAGFLIVALNALMTTGLLSSIIYAGLWKWVLPFFLVKSLVDYLFLSSILSFMQQRYLLLYFPLMAIIYPFYIVLMGFSSLFGRFSWKARNYK